MSYFTNNSPYKTLFKEVVAHARSNIAVAYLTSALLHASFIFILSTAPGHLESDGKTHVHHQTLYARLSISNISMDADISTSNQIQDQTEQNIDLSTTDKSVYTKEIELKATPSEQLKNSIENLRVKQSTPTSSEVDTSEFPPAPGYPSAHGLHRQPRLISDISVEYPASAGNRDGRVTLRILVSETGTIENIGVLHSQPKGYFEDAAINAFSNAQFTPGEIFSVPVKSQFLVELDFFPMNRTGVTGKGY